MRNVLLDQHIAADIDRHVARIHKDLRTRDRPVDLAEVRELLKLDLRYYTLEDPALGEKVKHELRIGAHRLARAPGLILKELARKFDLRAFLLQDKGRILIDQTLPDLKKRWGEGHEIAHSVIPWHKDYLIGDTEQTLLPEATERIEAEANYGCGRLIFPPKAFDAAAASSPPSMAHVRALAKQFGNTITSTLWRYAENHPGIAFALIGPHPHRPSENVVHEYFIRSRLFEHRFTAATELELFRAVKRYCKWNKGGPLGSGEAVLIDTHGDSYTFEMQSFGNTHEVLTLAWARTAALRAA